MDTYNENELVGKLKKGDMDSFERLLDLYGNRLIKTCYLILNDKDEAEDAVQETFIRVFRNIHNFNLQSSLYTWIYSIALNICRDMLKRRKYEYPCGEYLSGEGDNTEELVLDRIDREALREKLFDLPVIYKEVLVLYYFEGLTIKEIGQVLGEKEGTVKSKLSRGRAMLRSALIKGGEFIEGQV